MNRSMDPQLVVADTCLELDVGLHRRRKVERIRCAIAHIWQFLEEHLPLANTHGAEFISQNQWDKFIPQRGKEELMGLARDELVNLPLGQCSSREVLKNNVVMNKLDDESHSEWLPVFLQEAQSCCLDKLDILSSTPAALNCCDSVLPNGDTSQLEQGVISEAMSEKKIHEVGIMCQTVSAVFKSTCADIAIDVGSGKGYLSCELARKHGLPILGLDSIETNTMGAKQRDEKLGKRWKGLTQKKEKKKQDKNETTNNLHSGISGGNTPHPSVNCFGESKDISSTSDIQSNTEKELHSVNNMSNVRRSTNQPSISNSIYGQRESISTKTKGSKPEHQNKYNNGVKHCSEANCEDVSNSDTNFFTCDKCSSTLYNKTPVSSSGADNSDFHSSGNTSKGSNLKDKVIPASNIEMPAEKESPLYVPVTTFVHPEMNLRQMLETSAIHLCGNKDPDSLSLLLTGLHTCGSLAVTTMRLFLQDPGVVGLCYVGCCYHLMEESGSDFTAREPEEPSDIHFPLSMYGKQLGLYLGRNARNLASQSVHRIQASGQLQGGDFYWRALLDLLIMELKVTVPERIIGMRGLNKRSRTFKEYATAALKKLKLPPDLASDELLKRIEDEHREDQHKMSAFFQLKLALAPAIESLILLDRYLFLLEQECVDSVHLVQLFDPVISPRCYGFIAKKPTQEIQVS